MVQLVHPSVTPHYILTVAWFRFQGLHRIGKTDVPVYDGSWTEWGAHPDTPVDSTKE